jgi:hypothetical protein
MPAAKMWQGIKEVEAWSEPTKVLVLTDRSGIRRLRVEMLASDVTTEALDTLEALVDELEETNPVAPSTGGDSPRILTLVGPGASA